MHREPATDRSVDSTPAPAVLGAARLAMNAPPPLPVVFLGFFGFLLVGLGCVVDTAALDVTLVPRLLALSAFLLVAVGVVLGTPVRDRVDWSVLGAPVVLLFAGYVLVTCWSLLVAVNATAGFTDVFRTLATFVTLCLSCLLLPILPRWREHLLRLCVVAGLVGVAVGGFEIATRLGPGLHGRRAMEQITGLMSGVNLYAGMLSLILPWCLCGVVMLRRGWRRLAAGVAAAILALILLLQSRAAWLAVLAGAAAAAGALLIEPTRFNLSRRARRSLAIACLGGLATLAGGIAAAPADNPFAQRFRSIFMESADPAALPREGGRLMIWGITARMIADHPMTGVGAGNFTVRFHEYFDDGDDLDFSTVHTNWVQPHNDFLWVFAEKGLIGILLFAGLFVAACTAIRNILAGDSSAADRWLALAALAGLVTYGTLSCFDFPLERINHQVAFALLLAVVTVLSRPVRPAVGPPWGRGDRSRWHFLTGPLLAGPLLAGPLVVVALGLGVAYSLAAVRQEKEVIAARRAWESSRWDDLLAAARRARTPWKTLDPLATPVAFLEGMAQMQLGRAPEAIECLERARHDNPNRMYIVNNLGILYASTGRFDEAIECFNQTANRYPHRIEPFNNLAGCLIEAGRALEAVEVLEQIPEPLRNESIRRNLELARERAAAGDDSRPEAGASPQLDAP
jgi:O-antigen ligase